MYKSKSGAKIKAKEGALMKEIHNWPIGSAKLVQRIDDIPKPKKLIGMIGEYYFYKTRHGEFAIKEENIPDGY